MNSPIRKSRPGIHGVEEHAKFSAVVSKISWEGISEIRKIRLFWLLEHIPYLLFHPNDQNGTSYVLSCPVLIILVPVRTFLTIGCLTCPDGHLMRSKMVIYQRHHRALLHRHRKKHSLAEKGWVCLRFPAYSHEDWLNCVYFFISWEIL